MISKTLLRQLSLFALVGIAATLTHYFTALLTHEILGVHLYIANLLGYVCAVGVSYIGHGLLTFQSELTRRVFRRFVLVSVTTFCASELILIALEAGLQLPHRISLAVVVLIIPGVTFLLNKFWVYRQAA